MRWEVVMASMKWIQDGLLFVLLLAGSAKAAEGLTTSAQVQARHGVVVSASGAASIVGVEVLQRGGTSVDAAVATAFALAVTFPEAGNIGGGGFMLVRPAGEEPVSFDYRETAPGAASKDMFANGKPSQYLLVGTPGTVRGLAAAHKRFGKLPWKDLVQPAVRLAKAGFELDKSAADSLNESLKKANNPD